MPADPSVRNLMLVLCASGFATSFSFRTADPMIGLLARDFASDPHTVALLTAAFALPYALIQPILGPIGDAAGKERVMQVCLVLLTLTLALSAMMTSLEGLFVTRVLSGLAAGGAVPLGLALIGDRVPMGQRQVTLARYVAAMIFGQLTGSSAAGFLAEAMGWRAVFLACGGLVALGAVVVLIGFRNIPPGRPFDLDAALARYRRIIGNPRALTLFGLVFVEGACFFGLFPYVAPIVEGSGAGAGEAGIVLAGFAVGGLTFTLVVPFLLSRLGVPRMLITGGLLGLLAFAVIGFSAEWRVLFVSLMVLGLGYNMLHNTFQAQVTELSAEARASAVALHAFSFFLGQAVGVAAVGFALTRFGQPAGLVGVGAVVLCVGLAASYALRRPAPARA